MNFLRKFVGFAQHAINTVANNYIIITWFDVDVTRAAFEGAVNGGEFVGGGSLGARIRCSPWQ